MVGGRLVGEKLVDGHEFAGRLVVVWAEVVMVVVGGTVMVGAVVVVAAVGTVTTSVVAGPSPAALTATTERRRVLSESPRDRYTPRTSQLAPGRPA